MLLVGMVLLGLVTFAAMYAFMTYDCRVADGFLARSEWRRDFTNTRLFPTNSLGTLKKDQHTATLGLVWWWGTKRGSW
jgi:hypothetical protein